jgi:serine/threonine protein kinase
LQKFKLEVNEEFKSLKNFVENIKEFFNKSQNSIHKARNEIKVINYENNDLVVKSFKIPHFLNRFIYTFFRDSKAKRSYEYSLRIASFAPKPIGYIEFYETFLIKESYFISEKFDYDFTAKDLLFNDNFLNKNEILKEFAKFTYTLHENKIYHLDYSPGNILIKEDNGKYIFKIVDINRMQFFKPNIDLRMKNFAKLWATNEDLKTIAEEYSKISNFDLNKLINKIYY